MITIEDVLEELQIEAAETAVRVSFGGAVNHLESLSVENAKERVEWFNISILGPDDILILANVDFQVIKCDVCGDNYHLADVDGEFQEVHAVSLRGGETYYSLGEENQIYICNNCLMFNKIVGLFVS